MHDGLLMAREQVKAIEKIRDEQEKYAADLQRLRAELETAQLDRSKVEDRVRTVRQEWAVAVGLLQLPGTVDINTVETCLTQAADMQVHLKDARIKASQIAEIELGRDALLDGLNEVRSRLEPGCRTTTAEWIEKDFAELDRRLSDAQRQRHPVRTNPKTDRREDRGP